MEDLRLLHRLHISSFTYGGIHFNIDSMSNVLAVMGDDSILGVHISMDSRNERVVTVEYYNQVIKFQEFYDSLYYYDTANQVNHVRINQDSMYLRFHIQHKIWKRLRQTVQ